MASTKRDKELARQRAERQAARDTAAGQRRKQRSAVLGSAVAVLLVVVAVVAGAAVLNDDDGPSDAVAAAQASPTTPASAVPPAAPTESASTTAAGGCVYEPTGEPAAREVALPPTEGVEQTGVYAVTLATSQGDIVFQMDSADAPCTANSLRSLAQAGYFDGTSCHRLTTEGIEVLQCGDPTGTGMGGPGYQFADENLEGATYERGTVAMANAGPGTNGSQFFLVYGDSTLPPNYTPFGTITSGLDVLDKIAAAGSDESNGLGDGGPKLPVDIQTVQVEPAA